MTYGRPCVLYVDPLEKNALYHVAPGSQAQATATAGCHLTRAYCQNWDISQVNPVKILERASRLAKQEGL